MMQRLLKLLRLFQPSDWLRFGLIVVMMLGAAALELVGLGAVPLFVAAAVDPALVRQNSTVAAVFDALGADTPAAVLTWCSGALLAFFLCRTLYLVASYAIQDRIIRSREVELSCRLFGAYLGAPYRYHLERNSADMVRALVQEIPFVISDVLGPLMNVLRQGVVIVAVVTVVLWREPLAGLLTFTALGLVGLGFVLLLNASMRRRGAAEQTLRGAQYRQGLESFSVLKEARVLGRTPFFVRRYRACVEQLAQAQRFSDTARRSTWPAMELIVVAALLLAAVSMIRQGRPVQSLMPVLALFTVALARLKGSAAEFIAGIAQIRYRLVAVDTVYGDLLALQALPPARLPSAGETTREPVRALTSGIELQRVTFRYADDRRPAVHDVSLRIPKGASVAFVGATGSGKSTLADLIIGLLPPQEGAILADQQDIRSDTETWQRHIGYIPQAIVLLDDTIARNIALGLPDEQIDAHALQQAIAAAQLTETVAELPQGLHTVIGERGVRLSGGQRQRVGIARALYTNPDVLVMDEGTSALDSTTERAVVSAVDALKGERTIIMIAHRLSTVRTCDRLFYLSQGTLQAEGTFAELLSSCPEFAAMAALSESQPQ